MLIKKAHIEPEGVWGLWLIEENEDFFLERLDLSVLEKSRLDIITHPGRRLEWLAARNLLHELSERKIRGQVLYDTYGKPYLTGTSWQISISHSGRLAGVVASPLAVGIDVQQLDSKMERVVQKFLSPQEIAAIRYRNRLEILHVHWGVKEAMYKAYGKGKIDFKKQLHIEPFHYQKQGGTTKAYLEIGQKTTTFSIEYELMNDFVIVIAKVSPKVNI